MGSIPNEFPISLHPRPSRARDGSALPNLIQRMQFERGGFVNISEESLRQEIAEAEAEAENAEEDQASSDEETAEEPDRAKKLMTAKEEMLQHLHSAQQTSLFALDFISLLLSKDIPVQASQSISPALREMVGMGNLGVDKLHASRATSKQKQDNAQTARGWKSQNVNKTVDSILESATRLEREVELETRYWEQVLAVSDKGWAVCRLPNAKHMLGVRFGFSEASPTFRNQSLAALKRQEDGSISLDQGSTASEAQTIRVRIKVDDQVTGSSRIPEPARDNARVEELILQARNTIFAAELWQEVNREARNLGSFGVATEEDTITFPLSSTRKAVLDLVPLSDYTTPSPKADDEFADAISLSLNLLLSYSHRQSYRRRTFPPPPVASTKRPNPAYNLLRPLLTLLSHQNTLASLHSTAAPLTAALRKASLDPQPAYTISPTPPTFPPALSAPERTISSLTDRLAAVMTYTITADTTLTITIRTTMNPLPTSIFYLSLSPSSPLLVTCPPPTGALTAVKTAIGYMYLATATALANSFCSSSISQVSTDASDVSEEKTDSGSTPENPAGWQRTPSPSTLKLTNPKTGRTKHLNFAVTPLDKNDCVKIRVSWQFSSPDLAAFLNDEATGQLGGSTGNGSDKEKGHGGSGGGSRTSREGEGLYEWVGRAEGPKHRSREDVQMQDAPGDGDGDVVRSMRDVVADAAK